MPRTRTLTAAFATARAVFGAGLVAAPGTIAKGWIGDANAERPGVQIVLRALGARDIALSAGALAFLDEEATLAKLLAFTAACDLCDMAATLATPPGALPGNARWGTVVLAGASAAAGLALAKAARS